MDTSKLEKRLTELESKYGQTAFYTILTLPEPGFETITQGPFIQEEQTKLKLDIKDCLPDPNQATVREIARFSTKLIAELYEKVENSTAVDKLRELVKKSACESMHDTFSKIYLAS